MSDDRLRPEAVLYDSASLALPETKRTLAMPLAQDFRELRERWLCRVNVGRLT